MGASPLLTSDEEVNKRAKIKREVRFEEVPKIKLEVRKQVASSLISLFKAYLAEDLGDEGAQHVMNIVESKWNESP